MSYAPSAKPVTLDNPRPKENAITNRRYAGFEQKILNGAAGWSRAESLGRRWDNFYQASIDILSAVGLFAVNGNDIFTQPQGGSRFGPDLNLLVIAGPLRGGNGKYAVQVNLRILVMVH